MKSKRRICLVLVVIALLAGLVTSCVESEGSPGSPIPSGPEDGVVTQNSTPPESEAMYDEEIVPLSAPIAPDYDEVVVCLPMELEAGDRISVSIEVLNEPYNDVSCSLGSSLPNIILVGAHVHGDGHVSGHFFGFSDTRQVIRFNYIIPADDTYFIVVENGSEEDNEHNVTVSATRYPSITIWAE